MIELVTRATSYLEICDLVPIHFVLAMFGCMLTLYVMQITSHYQEDRRDPLWTQVAHRLGLVLLALTFLWQFLYVYDKGWQPWPPALAMDAVIIFVLLVRAIAVNLAQKRKTDFFHRFHAVERQKIPN